MQCDEIQAQLSAALDGELSPEERAEVDRHLHDCAECRGVLNDLQALDLDLRRSTVSLRESALRVAAAGAAHPRLNVSTLNRRWRFRTAIIAAIAMACGFLL